VLNLAGGLGSFTMGDISGGLTVLGGYAGAGVLIAWELSLTYEDDIVGGPGTAAVILAGTSVVYGIIRPFVYKNAGKTAAVILDSVQITAAASSAGKPAPALLYTWRGR